MFTYERSSTPTGFVWNTNMAAALLSWNTNMAAVTSRENALLSCRSCHWRAIGWPFSHSPTTMLCWDTFKGGPGVCHSVYKMVDSGSEIFATFEELKKSLFTSHYLTHYCYSWDVVRVCEIVREISMSSVHLVFQVTEELVVPVLVVIWSIYWGPESFCKLSLKEHVPGFMVFNSLLLKRTYFCFIFWISKESRTENWDELPKKK